MKAVDDVSFTVEPGEVFAPFNLQRGASPRAWHDLLVLAIWGVAGLVVALWRFSWTPRRSS